MTTRTICPRCRRMNDAAARACIECGRVLRGDPSPTRTATLIVHAPGGFGISKYNGAHARVVRMRARGLPAGFVVMRLEDGPDAGREFPIIAIHLRDADGRIFRLHQ